MLEALLDVAARLDALAAAFISFILSMVLLACCVTVFLMRRRSAKK